MSDVTQRKTAAGDAAAQQAQTDRLDRRQAALLKVKGVGEGLKGYPPDDDNAFADNGYAIADAAYRAERRQAAPDEPRWVVGSDGYGSQRH